MNRDPDLFNFSKGGGGQKEYGPTGELHATFMAVLWGPGINLAIIFAMYSYQKYYVYAHMAFGALLTIFTISTSLPIVLTIGLDFQLQNLQDGKKDPVTLHTHTLVGIAAMSSVLVAGLLGVATRIANMYNFSPFSLMIIKNTHRILGYLIAMLNKSNVYIIYGLKSGDFWLFFVQDLIFALLIIGRKIFFPKMEKIILPNKISRVQNYQSLSELSTEHKYCIFSNYIYRLQRLKNNHPAGYRIIEAIAGRDVDRFIYGMYGVESFPQIWSHSHSFKSLSLLGKPIGRINIQSVYDGFQKYHQKVRVKSMSPISQGSTIYQVLLQKQQGQFSCKGYKKSIQIGRFHSLSLSKTTRLYTTVACLIQKNKQFVEKTLKIQIPKVNQSSEASSYAALSENSWQTPIPLLIKVYPNGKFTQMLQKGQKNSLIISQQKGEGLLLQPSIAQNIFIIAGGTGLFPFYDFIDLFFKSFLLKNNPDLSENIIKLSPILKQESFVKFKVKILLAVNNIEDIHPIINNQLYYLLNNTDVFQLALKIKSNSNKQDHKQFINSKNLLVEDDRFQDILEKQEFDINTFSKVFICGPPKMNEALSKYFKRKNYDDSLYRFI